MATMATARGRRPLIGPRVRRRRDLQEEGRGRGGGELEVPGGLASGEVHSLGGGSFCSGSGAMGLLGSEEAALMSFALCYTASPGLQIVAFKGAFNFPKRIANSWVQNFLRPEFRYLQDFQASTEGKIPNCVPLSYRARTVWVFRYGEKRILRGRTLPVRRDLFS